MVKSELIQRLFDKLTEMQARDVELALSCIIEYMAEALESSERIEITGFGSFSVRTRALLVQHETQRQGGKA